jgi:hypothetical protein
MRIAKECWGDDINVSVGVVIGLPKDTVQSMRDCAEWYVHEGYRIVDSLKFVDLNIFPDDGLNQYKFLSDIEKDPSKYGYSFHDPINKPYQWKKVDEGDINSKQQAIDLMHELNGITKPYCNRSIAHNNWDVFKFAETSDPGGAPEAYYQYVTSHYFPKLMQYLRNG